MVRGYVKKGSVSKFGFIGDIDSTDTNEEVWIGEGAYPGFVAAAATTTVTGGEADDDGGTGALTVTILGLIDVDGVWTEVEETATMTGATPVELTNDFIRVYRAYVATAGSGLTNAGNIDVLHGATVLARIGAGFGQTLQAVYTVPDVLLGGSDISEGVIKRWYATVGAVQSSFSIVAVQTKSYGGAWRTRRLCGIAEGGWMTDNIDLLIPSKTDIRIRVISNGANNSAIAAGFDMDMW